MEDISRVTESGCREVILTGIHLGSYRYGDTALAGLVDMISAVPGLSRLRFGSIEPFAIDKGLLDALSASSVFCPHLHIPAESGDDGVLKLMRRGYDSSGFSKRLDMVRLSLGDDVHVSTDLMVGFPGEDERAFERSLGFLKREAFGKVHVFPFSPRKGTPAAVMPGQVSRERAKERVRRAIDLSGKLLSSYAGRWVGRESSILAESVSCGVVSGWNRHYLRIFSRAASCAAQGHEISLRPVMQSGGVLFCEGVDSSALSLPQDI
jgi:threonylcarbamoyladenosine tRNA methylthiotransferase MtaB